MGMRSEERGTLILPGNAVLSTRNALTDAINGQRAAWFTLAKELHAHLTGPDGKGDRQALAEALRKDAADRWHQNSTGVIGRLIDASDSWRGSRPANTDGWDRLNAIGVLLLGPLGDLSKRHLRAPRKKDLPPLPKAKTWKWSNSACSVSLDSVKRELHWSVPESKNAVEDAWDSLLGRTLNGLLGKVKWTRGTGGVFRYSNENMQDAALEHGGGGTSERGFGPIGERETGFAWRKARGPRR